MSVPLTFLEPARGLRLAKTITKDGSLPYPLAKLFTSHVAYLAPGEDGLREAYTVMQQHAAKGHALHKGVLKAPLLNEPRRGKADLNASTNLLVIDLDDYIPETPIVAPISGTALADLVARVRSFLPHPLNTTACIANASASTGFKASGAVGLHLFFLLDSPVAPTQLSHWLTNLNFTVDHFSAQLKSNRSGMSIKYIVDPVVSRNAQIIYIAPPELSGVGDAFASPDDRWVLCDGEQWSCELQPLLDETVPALVQQQAERILSELRKALGLKKLTPRYRKLTVDGEKINVLTNPDQMNMTLIRHTDQWAYWNINGGDSNAYYNPIGNPEVIYNFKGEPAFELKKANEEVYNWYCENFKAQIRDTSDPRPLAFREQGQDLHYAIEYNPRDDTVIRMAKIQKQNIEDWYASYGLPPIDPIPQWDVAFNPQSTTIIDWDNHKLNLFQPSELLRNPPIVLPTHSKVQLGHAYPHMAELCPTITRIIMHMCGDGMTEFEWFTNWLAYVLQTREKSGTAWVFSGVPGTGKGLFFERVLAPLIGEQYALRKRLDHLEDKFNSYLTKAIFVVFDEFRLSDSKADGRILNNLKDEITGSTTNIRAMQTEADIIANYTNYMFFSNHFDVIRIETGDRRFNIAPPQLKTLRSVWPNLPRELHMIEQELGTFAGFILSFDYDASSAHLCVENEAKQRMKQLAMGYNERFALAARTGELDYFLDVFDMNTVNDLTKATQITTAQKYVSQWAQSVGKGKCNIPVSDLFTVYIAMHESRNMTQTKLSQMLNRNDINVQRVRVNGERTACMTTSWFSELPADELEAVALPATLRKSPAANIH